MQRPQLTLTRFSQKITKTGWHTVYWKGSQEVLLDGWGIKSGKRPSKGYKQTSPLRFNFPELSVMLSQRTETLACIYLLLAIIYI